MTELKDICCDKDISIELKEKGFPQKSLFYWINDGGFKIADKDNWETIEGEWGVGREFNVVELCSAPTAEKLLKELPKLIFLNKKSYTLEINYIDGFFYMDYKYGDEKLNCRMEAFAVCGTIPINNKRLCTALSKCWVYLKENNLLK